MEANFHVCLEHVGAIEYEFTNDPSDHGGATDMGITAATLTHWRGHGVTAADVGDLGADEAKETRSVRDAQHEVEAHCR